MALAYGVSAGGTNYPPGAGTLTISITPTATAGTWVIFSLIEHGNTTATHGTATYNGNSMTFINTTDDSNNTDTPISLFAYYVGTPDGSAHNIVATMGTGAVRAQGEAVTITGADSTAGVNGTGKSTSTTPTVTVTTTADNSMLVGGFGQNGTGAATGTGTTTNQLGQNGGDGYAGWIGTTTTTTAGSYSATYSISTSRNWGGGVIEIKPIAAGPAGVKTWDGITQSSGIKTYFGVSLASIKSVDGVT